MEAVLLVVLIVAYLAFIVGIYCFYALCYAKAFQKAGLPAWWGWVPVVNSWGMVLLAGRDVRITVTAEGDQLLLQRIATR